MSARLVALEKCPGLRPVRIGEVFRRLVENLVLQAGGMQAKEACGSVHLCAGLNAVIEGAIHAVTEGEDLGRRETGKEIWERLET